MWKTWSKCLPSLSRSCGRTVLKNAGRSQRRDWLLVSGAAGLGAERGSAGFPAGRPAGSARRASGRLCTLPARCWRPPFRSPLSVAALSPCSLGRARCSRSARLATRPPAAVHSHSARPLRPPRVASASLSATGGSSVAALPGEPPGESQARGRIINHPRSPVPSARWFAPCAPGSSCTIAGSVAPRGSEGKRKQGETTQKLSSWTVLKWGREVPWCLPPRHVLLFRSLHQTHTKQELVYHPHSTKVVLTNTLRC